MSYVVVSVICLIVGFILGNARNRAKNDILQQVKHVKSDMDELTRAIELDAEGRATPSGKKRQDDQLNRCRHLRQRLSRLSNTVASSRSGTRG